MNTISKTSGSNLFREAKHSLTRSNQALRLNKAGDLSLNETGDLPSHDSNDRHSNEIVERHAADSVLYDVETIEMLDSDCSLERSGQKKMDMEKLALGVRLILEAVGEDVHREGLSETPARVARMYRELLYGTGYDPAAEITCHFKEGNDDPVIVKDIEFATICEHHLLPFIGKAHVAYIPQEGRITGLSKIARVVELTARRLQVQERMTAQIAEALIDALEPLGVLVILEAEHLCMSIRGVKKPGSMTTTMAARGFVKQDSIMRQQLIDLIKN